MAYVPDNYDLWKQREREKERRLKRLPKCSECGEPITDGFAYQFEGKYICQDCMEYHRVEIEESY